MKSHWNHRVVRRKYPDAAPDNQEFFYIHEAYYGLKDGDDRPSITTNATAPCGETLEGLRETLERMLKCLDKPVLDYKTRKEIKSKARPSTQAKRKRPSQPSSIRD